MRIPWLVAGLLGASLVATSVPGAPVAAFEGVRNVAAAAVACTDVLVVGARGSGEAPQGNASYATAPDHGFGATVSTAIATTSFGMSHLVTSRSVAVVYPALPISYLQPHTGYAGRVKQWIAGVAAGRSFVVALLRGAASRCPHQRFLLVGYSQGAMIMHQALGALAAFPTVLSRVNYATLIADPDRTVGQGTAVAGTASANASGIDTWLRHSAKLTAMPLPASVLPRTASLCNAGDLVCDFNASRLAHYSSAGKVHTSTYKGSSLVRAFGSRSAAMAIRSFATTACLHVDDTGDASGQPLLVCRAAAAGNTAGLVALLDASQRADAPLLARMRRSWSTPEAQLQMVRALRSGVGGADIEDFPFFGEVGGGGVSVADRAAVVRAGAWLGFAVPTSYADGWVPPYRGLVVSFVYNFTSVPFHFIGVYHYGQRDAGYLCRSPYLPNCI